MQVENMFLITKPNSKIKAMVSVLMGDILVQDIKVIEVPSGLFVGMPSRSYEKDGETKWVPTVTLKTPEAQNMLNTVVLDKYREMTGIGEALKKEAKAIEKPIKSDGDFSNDKDWFNQNENWENGW